MKTITPTLKIVTRTKNVNMCGSTCSHLELGYGTDAMEGWIWKCRIFGKLKATPRGMKQRHINCLRSENK